MPDQELAMLAFVQLAAKSFERSQLIGRDKFLVLAGAAACRAGWPEVAERCRTLVLENNPSHLIGQSPTFADAMRTDRFLSLVAQLDRFCTFEQAEHLLQELDTATDWDTTKGLSAGDFAMSLLDAAHSA